MSFWKSLFGGKQDEAEAGVGKTTASEDYKGFRIEAQPYKAGGQFQVAGTISKSVDGTAKSHRFVRADLFASEEEATACALRKGRIIVDENGESVLS